MNNLVVTAEEIRRMEARAMKQYGIDEMLMIENAARSLLDACPKVKTARIFCGTGNNGADGYALARHLKNRGTEVSVVSLGPSDNRNAAIVKAMGIPITPQEAMEDTEAELYVDALFGTGLSRDITGKAAELIAYINGKSGYKLAVDIPSGINADTGAVMGLAFRADTTVTFGALKRGLFQYPGHDFAGHIVLGDCSLPREVIEDTRCYLVGEVILPKRRRDANKGDFGRLLCVCGSLGMAGAAYMSAQAAVKSGCGLVTLAVPESILPQVASRLTEAMTLPLPDNGVSLTRAAKEAIDKAAERSQALLIGCGMRNTDETSYIVREAIERFAGKKIVLDADALNALSGTPDYFKGTVITPHPGEMARLLDTDIASVQKDRITAAQSFAKARQCTVVLKGALTVTAYPDGRVFVNTSGNAGMAGGGFGDVLAGLTASFMAQGMEDAPHIAAYLHGEAGDLCAARYSQNAMSAADILDALPEVIKKHV